MSPDVKEIAERLEAALGPHYRIEREIGRGGMGLVFLATDTTLDRPVAVKVIHPDLAARQAVAQRFLAEARMIARLRHPNIVSVYTAGEATGIFYYVMDYIPGETLRDRMNRDGRLSIEAAVRITAELAGALDAAAEAGLVHRDVKPENILLDHRDGRALLVDFGVARVPLNDASAFVTGQGVAVGTPTYMSPEQASGDEVDRRSDLYALGVVAYEMLAGHPPFRGPSSAAIISMQLSGKPSPITRARPEVPAPVGAAVMRSLEKSPDDRWQTGRELRHALQGESPAGSRTRRERPLAWVAAAAVLVLAAAGMFLGLRPDRGPPESVNPRHSLLILPFENQRADPDVAWLREGSVNMLALTLSQWNDLTVVDQERLHDLLARENIQPGDPIGLETARRLAREAGVWTVVQGEYDAAGDSLVISARVYDVATGNRVNVASSSGVAGADVRTLFDDLAAQLLQLSGAPGGIRSDLADVTTPSLEAYRSYLTGIDSLNHWNLIGADKALQDAISHDSTFGLAHYKLALTRGWLVGPGDSLGRLAAQRAQQYSEHLPLRERTMINAYQTFVNGNLEDARNLYYSLLERDSTDADAWYGLGDAWFHDTTMANLAMTRTRSLDAFQRAIALDPRYALAYEHAATMLNNASNPNPYLALVSPDSFAVNRSPDGSSRLAGVALERAVERARGEAVSLARQWLTAQPSTLRAQTALIDALVASESYDEALREVRSLRARSGDAAAGIGFLEGRIQFASGDIEGAVNTLRPLLDTATAGDFENASVAVSSDVNAAANVFSYIGDIPAADRALTLSNELVASRAGMEEEGLDQFARMSRAMLYGPSGGSPDMLEDIWTEAAESARSAPDAKRTGIAQSGAAAALWLFLGPPHDGTALTELAALTGEAPPVEVRALIALKQEEDTAQARRILEESSEKGAPETKGDRSMGDRRPLMAEVLVLLGEYHDAIDLLADFRPEALETRRYDARWGQLGRVRLLRAFALEKVGRTDDAASEYRALLDQLADPHPEVRTYVDQARIGLARLTGAG